MYFKFLGEALSPTWYATNSSGQFVATVRKLNESPDSWKVATGTEKKEEVQATGLTLEQAMDYVLNMEVG